MYIVAVSGRRCILIFISLLFISECSSPANIQSFKMLKKKQNPEDLQTKVNLLLYGHLYVVALLICAFVLMGKKTYI